MSIPEALAEKILEEIGIECDPATFRRTYAGKNQKAWGAFVWTMYPVSEINKHSARRYIGSIEPASRLVKRNVRLTFDPVEGEVFGEKTDL